LEVFDCEELVVPSEGASRQKWVKLFYVLMGKALVPPGGLRQS